MDTVALLHLAGIYTAARGVSMSYVGRLAANHGAFFSRLELGADVTSGRARRVVQWFSDHWPAGCPWPQAIPRPAPAPDSPAARAAAEAALRMQADPDGEVRKFRGAMSEAMDRDDWAGAEALEAAMFEAALALGPDGTLASPRALCLALYEPRHIYDDVVKRYANGRAGGEPRPDSAAAKVLKLLRAAGDARFQRGAGVAA